MSGNLHYSSTNAFNRNNASSHCRPTTSRYSFNSSIGCGLNSNKLSRPARTLCTTRTRSNTRRCFVIACRVSFDPSVSSEIDRRRPF